jgi:hypothetical protein
MPPAAAWPGLAATICLCVCLLAISRPADAVQDSVFSTLPEDGKQAWLVTFGPGRQYWERFGHNAIWLREPSAGLDHTFNFGFFDFEQEDFFLRFMRGRMLYFSVAQPAEREFRQYRQDNRSIRVQRLQLTEDQYTRLRDYLMYYIQPENRDYRYDYFLNNCSTRIRDALDVALDGALSKHSQSMPAELSFRDHVRRLTESHFWYSLGLQLGLGYPVDRPISRWEEMFIPSVVADELAALSLSVTATGNPLVVEDGNLVTSSLPSPPEHPSSTWPRYLLFGFLVVAVAWLSNRFMPPVWLEGLCGAWLLISATGGLILAALWFLTDHETSKLNANLLLLNPLVLVALVPRLRRQGAWLLILGAALCTVLLLVPGLQYNLDVFAFLVPINLAVAWRLFALRVR